MPSLRDGYCEHCQREVKVMGVEYGYPSPERYDGVSEFVCGTCGRREGRWTGRVLTGSMVEPRFGGKYIRVTDE